MRGARHRALSRAGVTLRWTRLRLEPFSEQGRRLERSRRTYATFCREDGSFELPEVEPGTYDLKVQITQPRKHSVGPSPVPFGEETVAQVIRETVVPEPVAGSASAPLDLGPLELSPAAAPGN